VRLAHVAASAVPIFPAWPAPRRLSVPARWATWMRSGSGRRLWLGEFQVGAASADSTEVRSYADSLPVVINSSERDPDNLPRPRAGERAPAAASRTDAKDRGRKPRATATHADIRADDPRKDNRTWNEEPPCKRHRTEALRSTLRTPNGTARAPLSQPTPRQSDWARPARSVFTVSVSYASFGSAARRLDLRPNQ
jgi:hypothetical protein